MQRGALVPGIRWIDTRSCRILAGWASSIRIWAGAPCAPAITGWRKPTWSKICSWRRNRDKHALNYAYSGLGRGPP